MYIYMKAIIIDDYTYEHKKMVISFSELEVLNQRSNIELENKYDQLYIIKKYASQRLIVEVL